MSILRKAENYFLPEHCKGNVSTLYRYRLLLHVSIFTSLFSAMYLILSIVIQFPQGILFMTANVAISSVMRFLMKKPVSLIVLSNIYVFTGSFSVYASIFFSGGVHSPVLPWLILSPVLALLILNRKYAYFWSGLTLSYLTLLIVYQTDHEIPSKFNEAWREAFTYASMIGLISIITFITIIFENNTIKALNSLENRTNELEASRTSLSLSHQEISSKNKILTTQKETLEATSEQLKNLHDKKDYLLEIIAHDLKSPLAAIQALVEICKLQNTALPKDTLDVLNQISTAAKQSQTLIGKILSAENLQKLVYNINLVVCDVAGVLQKVINDNRSMAKKKDITLQLVKEENQCYNALVDPQYLIQVFQNLIDNAVKFSPRGKNVFITVGVKDHKVTATIEDEGAGIAEAEVHLLFQKYKTLSSKPTAGEASTGLGLSIAKHYAQLLNGDICYESMPGKGAVFVVELPAHQA